MSVKYWNQRRYTAWYTPQFRIRDATYEHSDPSGKHLRPFIDSLKESILVEGLKNPLLVTVTNEHTTIHPGKCRAKALLELGWEYAPAVVVDYRRVVGPDALDDGCIFLDNPEHVKQYFRDDCVVEMSHRWLTIKKLNRMVRG